MTITAMSVSVGIPSYSEDKTIRKQTTSEVVTKLRGIEKAATGRGLDLSQPEAESRKGTILQEAVEAYSMARRFWGRF